MTAPITSTANPRIKSLARLSDRSGRNATGRFPVEGARMVTRLIDAGWEIDEVVFAPVLATRDAYDVAQRSAESGNAVLEVGDAAFRKIAYRQHPDGILAVARRRSENLSDLTLGTDPLILVAEGIEKPGNLGAMLRSADGVGATAVIAADPATDVTNPNVVRASQGSLFTVPVAVADAATTRRHLTDAGVRLIAAHPTATAPPWEVDLTGPIGLVVGSEHEGLSAAWDGVDQVAIPMRGAADSLNASTAAAVLLYEALRQRT